MNTPVQPSSSVVGVILAGGLSSRFDGAAKGLVRVDGIRIVDRVAEALGAVCDDLLLVANVPDATRWVPNARTVADVRPNLGALGGIHAALSHARAPVIVVAWDMPFVTAPLLVALRDERGDADAAVPIGPDGAEPLCACYGPRCLDVVERLLDAGERRARALADAVDTRWLRDVARFGPPDRLFANVNTPADLARWTR